MVQTLELKVPPPAVTLLIAIAMWLAVSTSGAFAIALPRRLSIAIALAVLGAAIAAAGIMSFRRARTTVNPTRPDAASSLVATGVYRFTRNPMYLGLFLLLSGWAIYLSNAAAFAGPLLFVLYINRFQIVPEERALAAKFGTAFDDYRRRTRRWI
ncbi:MAG: isoprenylcysteine carboxylmethyltransferase family protein [Reyranella sp.]|nr:isoprenylcysteine carboxylmethyltransferase family protein [Reyranella sp.]